MISQPYIKMSITGIWLYSPNHGASLSAGYGSGELSLGAENRNEALQLARLFSLEHRLKAHPFKLSEGEKRRLTLCIALGMKRSLIIMDEPTYGLDREARRRLVEYFELPELADVSILLVSHDSPFIRALANGGPLRCRTLRLSAGRLEEVSL